MAIHKARLNGNRIVCPRGETRALVSLALCGIALAVLFLAFAMTDRTLAMRGRQLALFFASFAVFLLALLIVQRGRLASPTSVWVILIAGVLFRVIVAPARQATTSDIYRYIWEGRVVRAGLNPYLSAPRDRELVHLRNWVWPLVQYKSTSAAYPPIAQYVFAAAGLIPAPSVVSLKLLLGLADCLTVLLLPGLCRQLRRPPSAAILYAWHPLAVCEVVARGHIDAVGILLLVLALRLLSSPSPPARLAAGAALVSSVLVKGYAALVLPFFVLAVKRRRAALFILAMLLVGMLAYLPFLRAGPHLLRGMLLYADNWEGNSSVFALLNAALAFLSPNHDTIARRICALLIIAWVAVLSIRFWRRGADPTDLAPHSFLALAGFFILSPAVYPWYLAWTIPFLCLQRSLPWLLLTGSIFSFYAHDFAGHHNEIWWVTLAEYGIPLLVWLAAPAATRKWRATRAVTR